MPRRERPTETTRSEHWLRFVVNERAQQLNSMIAQVFGWSCFDDVRWLSPIKDDDFAEYYDQEFLDRLGLSKLRVPLREFWPRGGPRWDGLAKTESGKVILVEAKAYIEEAVDYKSKAGLESKVKISTALANAKAAFRATADANWEEPLYQYTNRLAHLYYLRKLNQRDAYLLFVYFADAPDVPKPCTTEHWEGAIRLAEKCLGLGAHPFRPFIGTMVWSVGEMLSSPSFQRKG